MNYSISDFNQDDVSELKNLVFDEVFNLSKLVPFKDGFVLSICDSEFFCDKKGDFKEIDCDSFRVLFNQDVVFNEADSFVLSYFFKQAIVEFANKNMNESIFSKRLAIQSEMQKNKIKEPELKEALPELNPDFDGQLESAIIEDLFNCFKLISDKKINEGKYNRLITINCDYHTTMSNIIVYIGEKSFSLQKESDFSKEFGRYILMNLPNLKERSIAKRLFDSLFKEAIKKFITSLPEDY